MHETSRKSSHSDSIVKTSILSTPKTGNKHSSHLDKPFLTLQEGEAKPSTEFTFEYRKLFVYLLTLNASLNTFCIGWSFGVLDPIQINLAKIFQWEEDDKKLYLSFMSSAVPIGAVFGSLFAGVILSRLGRKSAFLVYDCILFTGVLMTLILNEYAMIGGRFITGLSSGGFSAVVSVYVNEFVPYAISGSCGAIYECFFCFGVFTSYLFGLNLPPAEDVEDQWWRVMIAFPFLIGLINLLLLLFIFKEESPKYLYTVKGDTKATIKSLKTIYKRDEDIDRMLSDYKELSLVQSDIGINEMFSKKYRGRLILVSCIMIAQQTCGIDALLMYSDTIFLEHISSKKMATFYTNFIGLSQVAAGFVTIFIIEKLGRKTLLVFGMSMITFFLGSISFCYFIDFFPPVIYLFICFTFVNGLSLSPVSYVYAPDILPDNGVAIGMTFNYIASFLVTETFLFLKSSFLGLSGTIMIYMCFTFLFLLVAIFGVKETKGLTASEIEELWEVDRSSGIKIEHVEPEKKEYSKV